MKLALDWSKGPIGQHRKEFRYGYVKTTASMDIQI